MSWLLSLIFQFILDKLAAWVHTLWARHEANVAVEEQAAKDEAQLAAAKTQQEKENAANAIDHDTFGGGST